MRAFAVTTLLAAAVAAAQSSQKIDVKLQVVDNTNIKAILTNNGPRDINVVTTGSILSPVPVHKVQMFSYGSCIM